MFNLDEAITEEIIFAMENQELECMIHAETGDIVTINDDSIDTELGELDSDVDMIEPPEWSSADGFELMEAFAAGVSDPVARTALAAALSKGRGVFKAFKLALEPYPELEKRWFDYKLGAMSRRIAAWYDEARVARGLERLGPEPEDADDLLEGDFALRLAGRDAWQECMPLFRQGIDEAMSSFPEALVEYEYTEMERELAGGGRDGLVLAIAEAIGGAIVAVAVARKVFVSDSSFGKLIYLYVDPEQRRMGLGRRLTEMARQQLAKEGVLRFVVDMPFVPSGFGASMTGYGYDSFGTRYIKTSD